MLPHQWVPNTFAELACLMFLASLSQSSFRFSSRVSRANLDVALEYLRNSKGSDRYEPTGP